MSCPVWLESVQVSSVILIGLGVALSALGVALSVHVSWRMHQIRKHVTGLRAAAGLPPLPFRHAIDFVWIAGAYIEATARKSFVVRTYLTGMSGMVLFVGGLSLVLRQLDLPK